MSNSSRSILISDLLYEIMMDMLSISLSIPVAIKHQNLISLSSGVAKGGLGRRVILAGRPTNSFCIAYCYSAGGGMPKSSLRYEKKRKEATNDCSSKGLSAHSHSYITIL